MIRLSKLEGLTWWWLSFWRTRLQGILRTAKSGAVVVINHLIKQQLPARPLDEKSEVVSVILSSLRTGCHGNVTERKNHIKLLLQILWDPSRASCHYYYRSPYRSYHQKQVPIANIVWPAHWRDIFPLMFSTIVLASNTIFQFP